MFLLSKYTLPIIITMHHMQGSDRSFIDLVWKIIGSNMTALPRHMYLIRICYHAIPCLRRRTHTIWSRYSFVKILQVTSSLVASQLRVSSVVASALVTCVWFFFLFCQVQKTWQDGSVATPTERADRISAGGDEGVF